MRCGLCVGIRLQIKVIAIAWCDDKVSCESTSGDGGDGGDGDAEGSECSERRMDGLQTSDGGGIISVPQRPRNSEC